MKAQILLIALLFVSSFSYCQKCEYRNHSEKKRVSKDLNEEQNIRLSKPKVLFSKYAKNATSYFVKTETGYFWSIIFNRGYSARFEIFEENPIIIQFANNNIIKLYAKEITEGKFLPLSLSTTYQINPYYKVNKEQLEMFTSHEISNVRIYFVSDKVVEKSEDEMGSYFEFDIQSNSKRKSCMKGANCMLQYN